MTKQHFARFAEIIAADLESSKRFSADEQKRTRDAAMYAADAFAKVASATNGKFDRERFMEACGLGGRS
jgi:hypothetical protein